MVLKLVETEVGPGQAEALLEERVAGAKATLIVDRGGHANRCAIPGLRRLDTARAGDLSALWIGDSERCSSLMPTLRPETLAADLAFLVRAVVGWLGDTPETIDTSSLKMHVGELQEPAGVLGFLTTVLFGGEPSPGETAVGGRTGLAAWRKLLRGLGPAAPHLLEDPWFAFLFMGNDGYLFRPDASLILVSIPWSSVPGRVASRIVALVIDRVLTVRAHCEIPLDIAIFMVDADDLSSGSCSVMKHGVTAHRDHIDATVQALPLQPGRPESTEDYDKTKALLELARLKSGRAIDAATYDLQQQLLGRPSFLKGGEPWIGTAANGLAHAYGPFCSTQLNNVKSDCTARLASNGFVLGTLHPRMELPEL